MGTALLPLRGAFKFNQGSYFGPVPKALFIERNLMLFLPRVIVLASRTASNWTARVNAPLTAKELNGVRVSMERGQPHGDDDWVRKTVRDFGLEHTVRPEGRPRKASQTASDTRA